MPRRTKLSDLIVCAPLWKIPTDDELENVDVGKTEGFIRKNMKGLRKVQIEAMSFGENHAAGIFQSFELQYGTDGQPKAGAHQIAAVVRARGIRHAYENKWKITYRIFTTTSDGKTAQHRFTVDPSVDPDYLESKSSDDDVDDEQAEAEEEEEVGQDDDGDPEDDEDDDEDDDDEDEDADDDEDDDDDDDDNDEEVEEDRAPAPRPRMFTPAPRQPEPRPAESRPLPPSMTVHPSVEHARSMGVDVKPEAVHMQVNPDFIMAVADASDRRAERLIRPLLREVRLSVRAIRREASFLARDSRLNARRAEQNSYRQVKLAHRRAEKAEQKLCEISELNQKHYENFQLIAQHGWTAFRNSMEREANTYLMQREYDKILLGQHLMFERSTDRTGAASGIVGSMLPMALGMGAFMLRRKGDEKTADLLEFLAKAFAPQRSLVEDDDDEDEGDEEEVIDAEVASPGPSRTTAPPPNGKSNGHATREERFDERRAAAQTPVLFQVRKLWANLSDDQKQKLKKIMPLLAWTSIEEAANATFEEAALASMVNVKAALESNPMILPEIMNVLDDQQKSAIMQLMQIAMGHRPKPRGMPRRPGASASA